MIICAKCGKENQDHYKFCLGCGAELPRETAPKQFSASNTPPQGVVAAKSAGSSGSSAGAMSDPFRAPPAAPAPVPATISAPPAPAPVASVPAPPPAAPAANANEVTCPQCGSTNAKGVRFCMSCGFNLSAQLSAPPPAAPAPAPGPAANSAILTALRADKSEVGSYTLNGTSIIGRDTGSIFAGDSYLSPRHATFALRGGRLFVKDEASLNGTFVKLVPDQPVELHLGEVFRIGQEIVRFEPLQPQPASPDGVERLGSPSKGYVGRLALVIGRDVTGNAFPVPESGVQLGRERGDIVFPEDGYVSGLHCRIRAEGGKVTLTDLGSSNGTFLRIQGEIELKNGDEILMGQQLFRVTLLRMENPVPRTIRVVAAVTEQGGRYLITQRRPTAVLPLLWEFPGGRVEPGETDAAALKREVKHRLGVDIEVGQLISFVSHPYEKYVVDLYLYECRLTGSDAPSARAVHAFEWVSSAEFDQYTFTPADEASMNKLLGVG